jgi:hypothetical protein
MFNSAAVGVLVAAALGAAAEIHLDSDCDGRFQGCDTVPPEELQGLDLLQTSLEVRLPGDLPVKIPKQKGVHYTEKRVEAGDVAFHSAVAPLSLLETGSRIQGYAMASFVLGLASRDAGVFVMALLLLVIFGVCVAIGLFAPGHGDKELFRDDGKSVNAPAHQLLNAPSCTDPWQSPIKASVLSPQGMSVGPALGSAGANSSGASALPPICPSLILPHTEARFMIPTESLMRAGGELDIRGTSGRKLLHGSVSETAEGRRCLKLASCGCEEDPRVTVLGPSQRFSSSSGTAELLEIFGKGGKFYGTLEPAAQGGAVLRHEGELVMSLEIASDLRMTASSMDGRRLASAGKNVQLNVRSESGECWKMQVQPNFDAVLVAACMLGALLFMQS